MNRNWGDGITERENFPTANTPRNFITQETDSYGGGKFQFGRIGVDYFLDNRNTISLSQNIVGGSFKNHDELGSQYFNDAKGLTSRNNRITDSKFGFNNYTTTLGFKHLFAEPNREITADVSMNKSNNDRSGGFATYPQDLSGNPAGDPYVQSNSGKGNTDFYSFQADYVDPMGKTGKFETGVKGTFRNYTSIYDVFQNGNMPMHCRTTTNTKSRSTLPT